MVVFQRTPNFSIPARNGPGAARSAWPGSPPTARATARPAKWSRGGVPLEHPVDTAASVPREEQLRAARGRLRRAVSCSASSACSPTRPRTRRPTTSSPSSSATRSARSSTDPETAETLCPKDHPFGTKRPCLDTGYYETFNLPHVRLVDLRKTPINTVTETGIETTDETFEFDVIVYATGFDAMTGAIVGVDITGKDGATLKDKWDHGPTTYLGLMTVGFPNLFMITGPGSPSVLSNMAVSIEQHVDWIADQLGDLRDARASSASSRPRRPRPAGSSTSTTAPTSRSTRRPTRGTWAPTCPASRACSCPTSAASTATAATCDEVVEQDFLGFELAGPGRHAAQRRRRQPAAARRRRWCSR